MKKTAFACLDLDLTSNWKLICIVMYLNFLTMINRIQLMFRGLLWLHVEPYIYIYIVEQGSKSVTCAGLSIIMCYKVRLGNTLHGERVHHTLIHF